MLRLARITGDTILEERSEKIAEVFSSEVAQYPLVHTQFLAALDFSLGPSYEIVIAGKVEDKDTQEMIKTLRKNFLPNKVVLLMPLSTGLPEIVKIAPFLSSFFSSDAQVKVYVYSNYSCRKPAENAEELITLLSGWYKE